MVPLRRVLPTVWRRAPNKRDNQQPRRLDPFDKSRIVAHMALISRLRDFRVGGFAFEWHASCNSFASALRLAH
jgi:hypothetical protein